MSRFYLTQDAYADLNAIKEYLDRIPGKRTAPIREGLYALLHDIAAHPHRGFTHSRATRLLGQEVKTRLFAPYRIFYRANQDRPEVFAILHTARDIESILTQRLQ